MTSFARTGADVAVGGDLLAKNLPSRKKSRNLRLVSVAFVWGVLVVLYLGFVNHFAINEPQGDDGSVVPLVHSALHGHLTLSALWAQHLESRIFFPNLLFVVSGFLDHYNIRSLILLSAVIYIVSYFLLLRLYREYDGRPLAAVPCAVLGIIWFSLADVKNALWAFQVAWFMVVLCFLILLYLLTISSFNRPTILVLALIAAVVASFSAAQGFVLWPIGLFLLLWRTPWNRRTYLEAGIWLLGCIASVALFLHGYSQLIAIGVCPAGHGAYLDTYLGIPLGCSRFYFRVVGFLYPTASSATGAQEILGVVLAAIGIFVVVQSFRERRITPRLPLPSAMILFSILFDAMIDYGRFGYGTPALQYVMPQVVLLAGIATYAVPKVLARIYSASHSRRSRVVKFLCFCLILTLALLVVGTTNFGFTQARLIQSSAVTEARLVVNLSQIPQDQRLCYESIILGGGVYSGSLINTIDAPVFKEAREDKLSLFSPGAFKVFHADGPPYVPGCETRHTEVAPTH